MSSTTGTGTEISPMPPAMPRLRLPPVGPARTRLDGGWWPRSADPAAELPGLVVALDGHRTDLLIVPPDTSEQAAQAAMEQAAQAGCRSRALAGLAVGPGRS